MARSSDLGSKLTSSKDDWPRLATFLFLKPADSTEEHDDLARALVFKLGMPEPNVSEGLVFKLTSAW